MERGAMADEMDNESGSAYEVPSNDEVSAASDKSRSRTSSVRRIVRGRSKGAKRISSSEDHFNHISPVTTRPSSKFDDANWIRQDALRFATTFKAPKSAGEIMTPLRQASGSRVSSAKRKASNPPILKLRRAPGRSNKAYRELLNVEIRDAVARAIPADTDEGPLPEKQIGSSLWSPEEQDVFFSSLPRLGKDNVRGIAARIGSKSELEVQQYILLLHRRRQDLEEEPDWKNRLLQLTDYPAAIEVSDECSIALEKAADVLAIEQERHEEKKEANKWGVDSWLFTHRLAKEIDQDIRAAAMNGEEYADMPPALDLLNLKNWLELSGRVFMNTAEPEEDNWRSIAEEGELPAIRATAFEDFHSLTVNLTKRLVSATLWYTMSRKKAKTLANVKHGDVNKLDVEAAVKTLGLTANSKHFWTTLPRKRKLFMIDDEQAQDSEDDVGMSYDEVEDALGAKTYPTKARQRSQSQTSMSQEIENDNLHDLEGLTDTQSEEETGANADIDYYSSNDSLDSLDDDASEINITNSSRNSPNLDSQSNQLELREVNELAYTACMETFDAQNSRLEEERLWAIVGQRPIRIKNESLDMEINQPNQVGLETGGEGDWREKVEFWSEWEVVPGGISEEEFERNRIEMEENQARRLVRRTTRYTADDEDRPEYPMSNDTGEGDEEDKVQHSSEQESNFDGGSTIEEGSPVSVPLANEFSDIEDGKFAIHSPQQGDFERSEDDISLRGDIVNE